MKVGKTEEIEWKSEPNPVQQYCIPNATYVYAINPRKSFHVAQEEKVASFAMNQSIDSPRAMETKQNRTTTKKTQEKTDIEDP